MSRIATFGAPLIGQTEHALAAILRRQLDGRGLTRPQWISLTIAVAIAGGGSVDRDELVERVAAALKVGESDARAYIADLAAAQQLDAPDDEGAAVRVTDDGRQLHSQISRSVADITHRLWGDLPPVDLAAAAHVLSTVLARANQELSDAPTSASSTT
jgi:hypothetical protein